MAVVLQEGKISCEITQLNNSQSLEDLEPLPNASNEYEIERRRSTAKIIEQKIFVNGESIEESTS